MRKIVSIFICALITGLLIAACSSGESTPVQHKIEMSEFAFSPARIEAQVGQEVTLLLNNTGALDHELMIGQGLVKMNNRPAGYEKDLFSAARTEPEISGNAMNESPAAEHSHSGTMVVVQPGEQATISFVVTPGMIGEWQMGCFSQDGVHYDAGMLGEFIVTR